MSPKISIGSWAFSFGPFSDQPWSFEQILEYAVEFGYDGVEINGFHPHPHPDTYDTEDKCRELVSTIGDRGLGISGYAPDLTATPPDRCGADAYVAEIGKSITFCARCGIHTLRVDTVSPPDSGALDRDGYEPRFDQLVKSWRAAASAAAEHGITIVWEFEPGFWLNKPSEVLAMVQAVDHPAFKLLFDTSHAYMGAVIGARHAGEPETLPGGVAEYGRRLIDHIGHFHLIDSDGTLHDDETSTHTAFGKGHIDFVEALTAIKPAIAELPWWCVDFCFNPEGPTAGKEAASFVAKLREEVLG